MQDATDPSVALRAAAVALASTVPPDLADVHRSYPGEVSELDVDRWHRWKDAAVQELRDAATSDAASLRAAAGPPPDIDVPPPEWRDLLIRAAIEVEAEARPVEERAEILARYSLGGIPTSPGMGSEAAEMARVMLPMMQRRMRREGNDVELDLQRGYRIIALYAAGES